ncbi:MAG: ribokinase [Phycisphaerae bacterium]
MKGSIPRIVVIGGTHLDIAMRCPHIPAAGESICSSSFSYSVTGPGPRQAIQAALCGCHVNLISKVGSGPFGYTAKAQLDEYKVNTECVYVAEAKNTGLVLTLVDSAGENASCIYEGANTALTAMDIEKSEQIISQADVCLIHGRLAQDAIIAAIRMANVAAVKTILDPARPLETVQGECEIPPEYFTVDIQVPNLYEAADITEHSSANIRTAKMIGSDLIARGVKTAIITMGRRGSVIVDRNGAEHIAAFEIELVDKTACGDAFTGALAAYCAVKDDMCAAVEFASAAGALCCSKFGSIESLPTRAEIIEMLQKQS